MDYIETTRESQPDIFEQSEEEFFAWFNKIINNPEADGICPGTLTEFHANSQDAISACDSCVKKPECENKHWHDIDRIESWFSECFSRKPAYGGYRNPEPAKCQSCRFLNLKCHKATERRTAKASSPKPSVIAFHAPVRAEAIPTPPLVAESATAVDSSVPEAPACVQTFTNAAIDSLTLDDLVAHLLQLSDQISSTSKTNYTEELRAQFMAASFALNSRGVMPSMRAVKRGKFKSGSLPKSADDSRLSNDLRVIDLDWIAKHHREGRSDVFKGLLNDDGSLNIKKAIEFVEKKGSGGAKSELLWLSKDIESELFMLQGEIVRNRMKRLVKNKNRDIVRITAAINRADRKKKDSPEYLWQLYRVCVLNDWTPRTVIEFMTRVSDQYTGKKIRKDIDWLKQSGLPCHVDSATS